MALIEIDLNVVYTDCEPDNGDAVEVETDKNLSPNYPTTERTLPANLEFDLNSEPLEEEDDIYSHEIGKFSTS